LISTALLLLAQGLPVKIKDSSLAKKICLEVEKICKKLNQSYDSNWQTFPNLVAQYEERERQRLLNLEDGEARLANLNDMLAAILALYEAYEPQSIQQWEGAINKIFDESEGQAINLYSIHSGKGGEADVAFVINPENMPLIHKKQTLEEREQENNLLYVALTRGRTTLALVLGEDKSPKDISWLPQKYRELTAQGPEKITGVEVDGVQHIIDQTWTSWEKEHCAWLKSANWCIYQGENKRIEAFLPNSKTLRLEGMKKGAEYCAIWEVSECTYDFNGLPLPVCTSLYTQEVIAQAAKTPPGVEVDRAQEPIMETVETSHAVVVDKADISCPACGFAHEPGQNSLCNYIPGLGVEVTQKDLLEVLEKLQFWPRPKLRTVLRELVDRLGKETVVDLLG
jgi:hypothetical protein